MKTKHLNFRNDISELDGSVSNLKTLKKSLALLYHENSKFSEFEMIKLGRDIEAFADPFISQRASQPYKAYPYSKVFSIKEYEAPDFEVDLFATIMNRRSGRAYRDYTISLNEVGKLLHFGYGITGKEQVKDDSYCWHYRSVPSGGGLYPLEIYLYINNGMIPKGVYHYRADISAVELIKEGELMEEIRKIVYAEPVIDVTKCSCILFITSVFGRTLIKYGDRGYRFILQEVGLVSQNISLICQALGLSSCMVGGYLDNKVNELLITDGTMETIQGITIIGKI